MSERLTETAAQVAAEIPRYSWELMDEDQRDDLMQKVVLPRYMKETVDGVTLGPTWWSETLGATDSAITNRVYRLRKKESAESDIARSDEPTETQKGDIRGARSAIRKHPELADEIIRDPIVAERVEQALTRNRPVPTPPKPTREQSRESAALDLISDLRSMHKTIERVAVAVTEGRAVVSKAMADAIVEEINWLRNALDIIESGIKAGSLDAALAHLIEEQS